MKRSFVWKLNLDIILAIFLYSEPDTISAVMQTCGVLYREGAKYLLHCTVELTATPKVASFLLFMKAEERTERRQALWSLTIDLTNSEHLVEVASGLKDLFLALRPVSALERLEIHDAERLLSSHAELPSSIAALTSLKDLTILLGENSALRGDENALDLLENMRSALTIAHIELVTSSADRGDDDGNNGDDDDNDDRRELSKILSASQHTLVAVTYNYLTKAFRDGLVYPKLRHLFLGRVQIPVTMEYVRAFPNLSSIGLYADGVFIPDSGMSAFFRAGNQEQLRALAHRPWPSLFRFEGTVQNLYLMGLNFHIPMLRLRDDGWRMLCPALRVILMDICPRHVTLEVSGAYWVLVDVFAATFLEVRNPQIESLELHISLTCVDAYRDVKHILGAVLRIVRSLRLIYFHLKLHPSSMEEVEDCPHDDATCPARREQEVRAQSFPVHRTINALDLEAATEYFRSSVPTLKQVRISVCGREDQAVNG